MKKYLLLTVCLVLSAGCHHRPEKEAKVKGDKTFAEAARDMSKWIRSNNDEYWIFAKQNLAEVAPALGQYLPYKGILVGDAHLANFSSIPVTLADGSVAMKYVDIDFDDAGRGPLVLDLARLVITSRATKPALNANEVVQAYIKGLRGEPMETPEAAQHVLQKTLAEYDHQYDAYVADKTDKKSFKIKPGKIETYAERGGIEAADLQKFFDGMKIIDIARRPVDKGGSSGFLRLWVYVKNAAGRYMIYELKQLEPSSLEKYEPQPDVETWKTEVLGTYLAGLKSESLDLIDLGAHGRFWRREKKAKLIDIPYASQKIEKVQFVQQLTDYDAYYLGTMHGQQPGGRELAARMESAADRAALNSALEPFANAFLSVAAAKVARLQPVKN